MMTFTEALKLMTRRELAVVFNSGLKNPEVVKEVKRRAYWCGCCGDSILEENDSGCCNGSWSHQYPAF